MDDDPLATAAQGYLAQVEACLDLGSEVLARRGELGRQWNDIHRRFVYRIRDVQPTPSKVAEREALPGKANELAGNWERMRRDDTPLDDGLDGLRTSASAMARVLSDPDSRPEDIGACLIRAFHQYTDIAETLGKAALSAEVFTVGLRSFETAAEGYLSGRQGGTRPARRWLVYRILLPVAAITVPTLLIIVIIAIVIAVNQ